MKTSGFAPGQVFTNAILGLAAVFAALVLSFVLFNGERFLNAPIKIAFFLGLPLCGLVVFVFAFRLPPESRQTFAIGLVSVGVALYASEGYMALQESRNATADPVKGADFDPRSRFQMVMDYRKQGRRAYPMVPPFQLLKTRADGSLRSVLSLNGQELLPLGGVADALTILCNESGSYVVYQGDPVGFANPQGTWNKSLSLAAVGDSFAHGQCVSFKNSFVSLLRTRFPKTLNLGMSSNGPLLALATIKEFLVDLRPRVVLWFFYEGNDLPDDLEVEKRSPLLMRYLEPGYRQNLFKNRAKVNSLLVDYIDALIAANPEAKGDNHGSLQKAISFFGLRNVRRLMRLPSSSGIPDYRLFQTILAEGQYTVSGWGGRLYLVYLPALTNFLPGLGEAKRKLASIHERVLNAAKASDVPVIDLRKVFSTHSNPQSMFPIPFGGHYNEVGHAFVANTVFEALEKAGAP